VRNLLAVPFRLCLALSPVLLSVGGSSVYAQGPGPASVRVDAVREELVTDYRPVTGNLRAVHRAQVAAREKGLVLVMHVREGQSIKRGDVVVELDPKQLQLDLAVLDAEQAPLVSQVDVAISSLAQAERDLASLTALGKQKAANPKEIEDARTAVNSAKASKASAAGQLLVLEARKAKLGLRIKDMRVLAPFDGTVVKRNTEVGAWLGEGAPVIELMSAAKLEAWIDIPQDLYSAVSQQSQLIEVSVGNGDQRFSMEGYTVVPQVDLRGRSFSLVGPVPEGQPFAAGMSVRAMVPTQNKSKQLTIHRDALLRNSVTSFVYMVMPGAAGASAKAVPMDVRVLYHTAERAVIEAPRLTPGAKIVVEGNERLYPMADVVALEDITKGSDQ
jgi:RND family efflux transporter MFP subunit